MRKIYNDIDEKNKYISLICKSLESDIKNLASGSVQKFIRAKYLENFNIPIPTTDAAIKSWVDKISKPFDEKNSKENRIKELEEQVQTRIKEITENEDCDELELGSICQIKSGKRLPKSNALMDHKTQNPYLRIVDMQNRSINLNSIKYIDDLTKQQISKYIITDKDIYVSIAGTTGLVGIIPKELNNANLTENAVRLILKNYSKNMQHFLMYNLFYNATELFLSNTFKTTIPKLSIERLSAIKIPIPKDQTLITALNPLFLEIEKLQDEVKQAETLYKQYLDELGNAAIKKDSSIPTTPAIPNLQGTAKNQESRIFAAKRKAATTT